MEIVLLGTGSADGWPNPFCGCTSCRAAAAAGEIRGQTAALVDDTVLLDCGPEAPRAALRFGRSLAGVRHLLFTHGHPDHVGPAALLMRQWSDCTGTLQVLGPPSALRQCPDWVGPDDPVAFAAVAPGDVVDLTGGYRVRVLAAAHGDDAVLYDIATPHARMLWATDTGPLPEDTAAAIAGAGFDAVFLEETFGTRTAQPDHHDLTTFASTLARLRGSGAVTAATDVVAVHLSHHNPPGAALTDALGGCDARPGRDGETVRVGAGPPVPAVRTLVLGGARSGKSAYAEAILAESTEVTYLATGGTGDDDPEWAERVAAHRARRPSCWQTREITETIDLAAQLRAADTPVLLDCLGTWLATRIDAHRAWDGGLAAVHADIDELVAAWADCPEPAVAVSNEVGSGVVPATASGRLFRDLLGVLNARIAADSDHVVLMVAGVPLSLRGRGITSAD